ncbi:unnamed protein product [Cuscuta europaea]|uniref:Uncharacterized protein n=1 Tax=Cuscuta europaea TaxID=41803 RepID=A0A9P0ZJA4_CUSEU|nr:unnamed protein product [Cuscuta europaea]
MYDTWQAIEPLQSTPLAVKHPINFSPVSLADYGAPRTRFAEFHTCKIQHPSHSSQLIDNVLCASPSERTNALTISPGLKDKCISTLLISVALTSCCLMVLIFFSSQGITLVTLAITTESG